jgi:hypothetical protein
VPLSMFESMNVGDVLAHVAPEETLRAREPFVAIANGLH